MPYRTLPDSSPPNDVRRRRLIQSVPSHCCPVTEGPPLLFAGDLLLGAQSPSWHSVVGLMVGPSKMRRGATLRSPVSQFRMLTIDTSSR
jgi:hypothetical protein